MGVRSPGNRRQGGIRFDPSIHQYNHQLSHQQLAKRIGSARESVAIILGALQAEKCLGVGRRRIVLANPEALARIRVPCPDPAGGPHPAGSHSVQAWIEPRKAWGAARTNAAIEGVSPVTEGDLPPV